MTDLTSVKQKIAAMSELALNMWQATHRAFLEHDLDILSRVLEDENRLNNMEKELTAALVDLGRSVSVKEERAAVAAYANIVGDLELIGDYCKDILERVQIKIEERLLFSIDAVREYEDLYRKAEVALQEVAKALAADKPRQVEEVLKSEEHIDSLVDEYRKRHTQRLIDGACSPLAGNMFLNMLDFTAAVYYHAKKIARNLLKIKI